jgi:predicted nucleic acid-binding protein
MASVLERLAVDCSVVVKSRLTGEPSAAEAGELPLDWQRPVIELSAPTLLPCEIMSAFLRAFRQGRLTEAEALDAVRSLSRLPFDLREMTTPILLRAFELAHQYNQRAYDCIYVALAEQEGIELWTADQRLYNALHGHCAFIRWIADYRRKRP